MAHSLNRCFSRLALLFALVAITTTSRADESLSLDRASIAMNPNQPSYVKYAVEDLIGYIKDSTGHNLKLIEKLSNDSEVQIVVGPDLATGLVENLPDGEIGPADYIVKGVSKEKKKYIVATGANTAGTKLALAALIKAIKVQNKSAYVSSSIDIVGKPYLEKRGMHFNGWTFNSPYSFRTWKEEEWKSYLDILAYQGVNLFYLWPFIEIMPVPLSPEDTMYLEECKRVVDYAQQKHGMEVWIMQCTNRVAKDDLGVKDPRFRPYWRPESQQDVNPGDPAQFKRIMASREAMYKILNNVDAICNIDGDPGYYPGSPLEDYLKVLNGCRDLLDKHNIHGKKTKIVSWMWEGWGIHAGQLGSKFRDNHQLKTLQMLKKDLPEPWNLVACRNADFKICRQEKILEKAIYLPYGAIEGEPAYPGTNLSIDKAIRPHFVNQVPRNQELLGVMGNLQTPLLQFPHMYYYSSAMLDGRYSKVSQDEAVLEVATQLYPDHAQLIADCFTALHQNDAAKIESLSTQLKGLVDQDKLGHLGAFGRKLFPDHRFVAKNLILQLNLKAAGERLATESAPALSASETEKLIATYMDAYLAWDSAHGWHELWGWKDWPENSVTKDKRFAPAARKLGKSFKDPSEVEALLAKLSDSLKKKYKDPAVQSGCIDPFKNAMLNDPPPPVKK